MLTRSDGAATRPEYFPLLDGVRGLAAIVIMYRHMGVFGVPVPSQSYLGVDLFFVLSGAVIANAYEGRLIGGLTFGRFALHRVIRLYPMIAIGIALGALMCMLGAGTPGQRDHVLSIVALSLIVLPDNPLAPSVGNLDGPAWSLFYELIANAGYALGIRRLTKQALTAICAVTAAALVAAAFYKGHLDTGYTPKSFVFGLARVGFSFFAGVALYRLHAAGRLQIPMKLRGVAGSALAIALLMLSLLVSPSPALRPVFALAAVFFIFPTIVGLGLESQLGQTAQSLCRVLGEISYPLYLIHFPLVMIVGSLLIHHGARDYLTVAAIVFGPVTVALAWAMDRYIDAPVRTRLLNRLALRSKATPRPQTVLSGVRSD